MSPLKITASLCLAVGIFIAGYTANRQPSSGNSPSTVGQVLYYSCPMHPQYRSDHPGDCPSCGMRLVPTRARETHGSAESGSSRAPGVVQIDDAEQRLIGVRTAEVQKAPLSHLLRVPGRIAVDDARLYRIVAASDGWVRELGQNTVGSFVKKDQLLASYYVRDLLPAQQNYLYANQVSAQTQQAQSIMVPQRATSSNNVRLALDALRSFGMTEAQIKELERTREPGSMMGITAPASGFVVARTISPDQRFDKGNELYQIADLSHVWVLADVFEKDREFLTPHALAVVRYRGREFRASMAEVLPQFDPQSRTLKTRFELENPGFALRPDMFVDVEIHVEMPAAITVPADAVIDSGRRKTVYVTRGNGLFEPRLVMTGWRLGDRVQVTEGLKPGESIVVSSNFLIDSESRMKQAATAPANAPEVPPAVAPMPMADKATVKDPVCGMPVDSKAPTTRTKEYGGNKYFFCSDECKRNFEANPGKYVPDKMPAQDKDGKRGAA